MKLWRRVWVRTPLRASISTSARSALRGAGRHVAGVLLVARGVGDDELALVGRKEPVGDVDGDALLALGGEAIDEQREVDAFVADVAVLALLAEARELVVEDELAVVEQPADQRRLAVVDASRR